MKKAFTTLAIAVTLAAALKSPAALADGRWGGHVRYHGHHSHWHYGYGHYYRGDRWAAALGVGLILGALTAPRYVRPAYEVREVIIEPGYTVVREVYEAPAETRRVERVARTEPQRVERIERPTGRYFSLYCESAKAWQGAVKECAEGWKRVSVEG